MGASFRYSRAALQQQKTAARLSIVLAVLCILFSALLVLLRSSGVVVSALLGLYWAFFAVYQYRMRRVCAAALMESDAEQLIVRMGRKAYISAWAEADIESCAVAMRRITMKKNYRYYPGIRISRELLVVNRELLLEDTPCAMEVSGRIFALDDADYSSFIDVCAASARQGAAPAGSPPAPVSRRRVGRVLAVCGFIAVGIVVLLLPNRRVAIAAFFAVLGLAGLFFSDMGRPNLR